MAGMAASTDPRQRAYARFVVAHALVTERIEAALAAAGLPSLHWYDVLWVLESSPEDRLRMADLARRAVFSRSNLTRLADRMEKERLIERGDCPIDGRGTVCGITNKGRALRAKMWTVYRREIDALFGEHLGAREAETMANAFERIISSLRSKAKEIA
jgi:DNA-binding MarR family transcriptional regulator